MASGGLRGTSLSTDTNFYAGLNASNLHIPRHWIYVMLGVVELNPHTRITLSKVPDSFRYTRIIHFK